MRATAASLLIVTALSAASGGCTWSDEHAATGSRRAERVPFRFHVAADSAQEGWSVVQDEYGRPLYMDPTPALTEADIVDASALVSDQRSIVVLYFRLMASARLERVTGESVGRRFAVFVDNRLVVSPTIARPVTEGALAIDAGLSRDQADLIVRGYAAPAAGPR